MSRSDATRAQAAELLAALATALGIDPTAAIGPGEDEDEG